jgi:hypothetical protein
MKTLSWKSRTAATLVFCATALLCATQGPAQAQAVASVAPTQAGSANLVLNGTGARRGVTTYLYTANLYLEHATNNPAAVLQNNGTTQFRLVLLHDTSAAQMADLLTQGLVANASEDDLVSLVSEIFDIGVLLSEQGKLLAGDSFEIDAHPAAGTTVTIRSRAHSTPVTQTFANPRMFKAMMGIWLGEHPVDLALKQALLGQPI